MGAEQPPAESVETREPVAVMRADGEVYLLGVYLNEKPDDDQDEEHQAESHHCGSNPAWSRSV